MYILSVKSQISPISIFPVMTIKISMANPSMKKFGKKWENHFAWELGNKTGTIR